MDIGILFTWTETVGSSLLCPEERKTSPRSLKCFLSILPLSELSCHHWASRRQAPSTKQGVLRCVKAAAENICHGWGFLIGPCHEKSHSLSLSSTRGSEQFIFSKHNLPGIPCPGPRGRRDIRLRKVSRQKWKPFHSLLYLSKRAAEAANDGLWLDTAIRTPCFSLQ